MPNTKIKIKRGNRATVQNVTGEYGELILCQDSKELFFFDADNSLQRMRDVIVSNTEPTKIDNLLWLDTTQNLLKRWSQSSSTWINVTNAVDLSDYYNKNAIDTALNNKMNKVQMFATDNLLKVNASGQAVDSGKKISDFALNTDLVNKADKTDIGDKNALTTSNKADLVSSINELNNIKANDNDVVHKTGNETISGVKTFTDNIDMNGHTITNVSPPINGTDAANKDFVISYMSSVGVWQNPVISKTVSDPSILTPNIEDRYIVGVGSIGDWLNQDNNIAEWNGTSWTFYTVELAWTVRVLNEDLIYHYNGTSWVSEGSNGGSHSTLLDLQGGQTGEYYHLTQNQYNNIFIKNIDTADSIQNGINNKFYKHFAQATAPTYGMNNGDLWIKNDVIPYQFFMYDSGSWKQIGISQPISSAFHYESLPYTRGQTITNITIPYYVMGIDELEIFVDGDIVSKTDYTEISNTEIQFNTPILDEQTIIIRRNAIEIIDCGEI